MANYERPKWYTYGIYDPYGVYLRQPDKPPVQSKRDKRINRALIAAFVVVVALSAVAAVYLKLTTPDLMDGQTYDLATFLSWFQ